MRGGGMLAEAFEEGYAVVGCDVKGSEIEGCELKGCEVEGCEVEECEVEECCETCDEVTVPLDVRQVRSCA